MKCHVDAIQWRGGVVADIFRDLEKPMQFSGGGGSSRNVSLTQKAYAIQWGGGLLVQIFSFP